VPRKPTVAAGLVFDTGYFFKVEYHRVLAGGDRVASRIFASLAGDLRSGTARIIKHVDPSEPINVGDPLELNLVAGVHPDRWTDRKLHRTSRRGK
jgi:hypothetical protein